MKISRYALPVALLALAFSIPPFAKWLVTDVWPLLVNYRDTIDLLSQLIAILTALIAAVLFFGRFFQKPTQPVTHKNSASTAETQPDVPANSHPRQ